MICVAEITALVDTVSYCEQQQLEALLKNLKDHGGLSLQSIDQVMVIGEGALLRHIQQIRQTLATQFKSTVNFKASVYGPMQCMLKGVCAQCLQWQIDPATGKRTKAVYACSWQHQPLEIIDTFNLDERLAQNHMQERLTRMWYTRIGNC